jgi:hypothetical protein
VSPTPKARLKKAMKGYWLVVVSRFPQRVSAKAAA